MNKRRVFVVARWLLAAGLAIWTARQLFIAGTTTVLAAGAMHGFFGLAGLLGAAVLAAPEVVGWVISPLHRLIDAVLLPSESGPPPADYTLARFYCRQMRYEEATEEYLKIIHYHPRELTAYLEGTVAAGETGQMELARKFHRLGMRAFGSAAMRGQLDTALDASCLAAAHAAETGTGAADEEVPHECTGDTPALEPPEDRVLS